MPKETLNVGEIAQDVAEQVAEMVANSVATTKTNQLLTAAASAETARVNAENARASAETARAAAEEARATEFAGFEDDIDSKITRGIGERDGTLKVGKADLATVADNLVATKGLTVNDDPMSFGVVGGAQKSAVGDGNASLNKLVCVDVVRNQYIPKTRISATQNGITLTNNGDGSFTLNGTATADTSFELGVGSAPTFDATGHTILWGFASNPVSGVDIFDAWVGSITSSVTLTKNRIYKNIDYRIRVTNGTTCNNVRVVPFAIDLSKRYGSTDIANAIAGSVAASHVSNILAFDPEILSNLEHDTGTLVPSKTAKLLSVGVNQWDEEWEKGSFNTTTGANIDSTTYQIRSKKLIKVMSNTRYYFKALPKIWVMFLDANKQPITPPNPNGYTIDGNSISLGQETGANHSVYTTPANARYMKFYCQGSYGTVYKRDICINVSDPNINGKYYPSKRNPVTLPNYEGHGILKVVDGKVVADGTELYPDGNSKKRYNAYTFTGNEAWSTSNNAKYMNTALPNAKGYGSATKANIITNTGLNIEIAADLNTLGDGIGIDALGRVWVGATQVSSLTGKVIVYELATEEDIATPVFQSTFPVEQGGTLQFLDEDDAPIAGLQGSEIFYQKNIKAFVEAFGEAIDWDPARIERLANLSFTPEYVNITLNPSPTGAYARAQVYNATFTIVISAALTGTANGSITFQDSEVDLTNFQTKPADAIYDMDGKKVSEAPTTADCNIASFVGRSKSGIVLWSLLHSGVNKVKIHIEEAVPLDSEGNGKIDCRASLIL